MSVLAQRWGQGVHDDNDNNDDASSVIHTGHFIFSRAAEMPAQHFSVRTFSHSQKTKRSQFQLQERKAGEFTFRFARMKWPLHAGTKKTNSPTDVRLKYR